MSPRTKLEVAVYVNLLLVATVLVFGAIYIAKENSVAQSLEINLATELIGAAVIFFTVNKIFGIEGAHQDDAVGRIVAATNKIEASIDRAKALQSSMDKAHEAFTALGSPQAGDPAAQAEGQQSEAHADEPLLDGKWRARFSEGSETYYEEVELTQRGRRVKGTINLTIGPRESEEKFSYTFEATFKHLLLTGTYCSTNRRDYEQGSFSLRYTNQRTLVGQHICLSSNSDDLVSSEYVWEPQS